MRTGPSIGNRIAPLRFLLFLALFAAVYAATIAAGHRAWDGGALAFDAAALVFLVSLVPLLRDSTPESMRAAAAANDANRVTILVLTTMLTVVAMAAVAGEIGDARRGDVVAIVKLVGTLLLIWTFANSVYALHYAHMFYRRAGSQGGDTGGLDFPGTRTPTYGDFAYFAFTLAMTFQTSDVAISGKAVRHIALLHSFVAFLFNIGLIAFTINVLAGSSR
ncbi:MAG TPA: DUF1345 domain-containing protein [Croceibacterium sp.]|nr:DUF1345 domain-containing protein [Croceibacterium sp.]